MTILLLETLHPDAQLELARNATVVLTPAPDAPVSARLLDVATAIMTRGRGRVTEEMLAAAPHLRVVARCGVGVDNIDILAAQARGIPVVYAPGSTTQAVAEQTLMLMLALARQLRPLANGVAAGRWEMRNGYTGMDLFGKRLGVVGLGAIGRRVAELGAAFGMEVITWSRESRDARFAAVDSLAEILQDAHVVSLHTALTPETRHLIGAEQLALMRPNSLLINTARGEVVDQAAVFAALESGHLGGYAADVLTVEPPAPDDPLLTHSRALITPHVSALTDQTYRAMCLSTARNVLAVLRNQPPDPAAIYQIVG